MTLEQLKMLRELREIRENEAKKELENNKKKITEFIEGTIAMENVKVTRIGENRDNWSIDVDVIDDEGERIFGAGCDLYYVKGGEYAYHDKGIRINYGCSGSFDKSDTGQVDKLIMLSKIVQSIDELEEHFEALDTEKTDAYWEARFEVDNAIRELKHNYLKRLSSTLAVGNEYKDRYDRTLKITHITPKFVHYTQDGGYEQKERKDDFLRRQANTEYYKDTEQEQ